MDINVVRTRRQALEAELQRYLSATEPNQNQITITRGRLLRTLQQEYKLEKDPAVKNAILQTIKFHSSAHVDQLNDRISKNKDNKNHFIRQISTEIGLKFRRLSTIIGSISKSQNFGEGALNTLKTAGNAISLATSVAKIPIIAALRLGSVVAPLAGRIIVQPLQIPGYLFSKLINPDAPYNGMVITNVGNFLGQQLGELLDLTQSGIRKL